jgi:pimeloyl-ACP methyl ester carboxylesterase
MTSPFIPYIHESGEPEGRPLVVFHGFPGSHIQGSMFEAHAKKYNVRILAPDRPGYGYSDPLPGKGLSEFLDGLNRALERKKIERFYVAGVSGGNPSALCTAARFGQRVLAVGSICGLAPYPEAREHFYKFARTGLDLAMKTPEILMRPFINQFLKGIKPEEKIDLMVRKLSQPDQKALENLQVRATLLQSMALARRQGAGGMVFDLKSFATRWPCQWQDIQSPHFLWHGEQDRVLSHTMSEFVHAKIPHSRLKLYPEEGHYSLPILRAGEILADLTGA